VPFHYFVISPSAKAGEKKKGIPRAGAASLSTKKEKERRNLGKKQEAGAITHR